ncbi:hypothetical protein Bca4012_067340 [Brassica carinata]|uniref:FLZ-type domain-containing protein n=1 Tax=Brassica carinata TaxID=52824 RepID=A0A8X7VSR9_BRACI|nr:hypothetical protein Bca52824_019594 [Brassica carinata]
MVGLSIILESANNNTLSGGGFSTPKPHQVVNKSAVMVTAVSSDLRRGNCYLSCGFLEHCFLCRKKLLPANDIYMYKGDRAFCSVDCRSKQIIMDEEEESLRRETCSSTAVKTTTSDSSSGAHHRHRRDPRNRAGGFTF